MRIGFKDKLKKEAVILLAALNFYTIVAFLMKFDNILAIIILAMNLVDGGPYPQPPPPAQQRAQAGLNFSASLQQAKDQIRYFIAGEKPIHASIDNLEDYYVYIKEKDMRKFHPRRKLRKPCKVLSSTGTSESEINCTSASIEAFEEG